MDITRFANKLFKCIHEHDSLHTQYEYRYTLKTICSCDVYFVTKEAAIVNHCVKLGGSHDMAAVTYLEQWAAVRMWKQSLT